MKTILVPTDYSAVSKNAAIYALHLAKQLKAARVILYNAYQAAPMLTEATMPIMPVMDIETLSNISTEGMKYFRESLATFISEGLIVEEKTAYGIVTDGIEEICLESEIYMVVMGISGTSKLEEIFIGSTATSVLKHIQTPVIVVPAQATFNNVEKVLFTCDYDHVVGSTPMKPIRDLLNATGASLHVINIYKKQGDFDADLLYEEELTHSILSEFSPQYHAVKSESFIDGINKYVDENKIDLIITIPKKHGFFETLFHEPHTKQLAFHSHVPLMSIHEGQL